MSNVRDVACETYLNLVFCIMLLNKSSNNFAKSVSLALYHIMCTVII